MESRLGPLVLVSHAARLIEYSAIYAGSVIVARTLGVDANGEYALLVSLAQALLVLSSVGADAALNRHIPQIQGPSSGAQIRHILRRMMGLRLIAVLGAGLVLWAFASRWAGVIPVQLQEYFVILLAYAGVRAIIQLLTTSLLARFQAELNARIVVVTRVTELVGIIVLAELGMTVRGLLLLLTGTGLLQVAAYAVTSSSLVFGPTQAVRLRPVLLFGAAFWLNALVDYFLGKFGDVFLLTTILRETSQASLYDISYAVTQAALLAATAGFAGLSFANFARLSRDGTGAMNRFYISLVRTISVLTIPLFAFLMIHASSVITLLYSPVYASAAALLQIMAGFRIATRLFAGGENAEYLLSRGKVAPLVGIGVLAAGVNIGLDIALIPSMKATGAALAGGSANLLVNSLGWLLVRREGGPGVQTAFWLKLVLMSLGSAWVAALVFEEMLLPQVILYLLLLGVAAFLAKPFNPGDALLLKSLHPALARIALPFVRKQSNTEHEPAS